MPNAEACWPAPVEDALAEACPLPKAPPMATPLLSSVVWPSCGVVSDPWACSCKFLKPFNPRILLSSIDQVQEVPYCSKYGRKEIRRLVKQVHRPNNQQATHLTSDELESNQGSRDEQGNQKLRRCSINNPHLASCLLNGHTQPGLRN